MIEKGGRPPSGLAASNDWTNCQPGAAAKVEAACTAVIEMPSAAPRTLPARMHGDFYRSRAMYDRAFADLDAALALDPHCWEAHYIRGVAYRDKMQLDEAIADFDRAIEYAPQRPNPHIARGKALELRHNSAGALKESDQAVALRISGSPTRVGARY